MTNTDTLAQAPPRAPMVHDLKCWPPHFAAVRDGFKPFEVRKNDRDFRVGDTLRLWEFDPERNLHTGMYFHRLVTYALSGGQFGVEADHVVLGLAGEAGRYREALEAIEIALEEFADEGTPGDQPLTDGERMALEALRVCRRALSGLDPKQAREEG